MQETRVQSLGREDPLEKEMVTHSSTLTWRIPWTEKPSRLQSTGSQSRPRLSDPTSLAPLLCPFICQRAFELSPCPGCCQYRCTEHWAACVFVNCNFVWILGLPRGRSHKESACQCRRHKRWGFDPWARKIPWSRKRQPTSLFLPGKYHGQRSLSGYSPWDHKDSDVVERLGVGLSDHVAALASEEPLYCFPYCCSNLYSHQQRSRAEGGALE